MFERAGRRKQEWRDAPQFRSLHLASPTSLHEVPDASLSDPARDRLPRVKQGLTLNLVLPKRDLLIQDQGVLGLGIGVLARLGQLMCR